MDSDNESLFTISSKQTLIAHQTPPKPPITKTTKIKKTIFLASITSLIIILVAASIISISISKTRKPDPPPLNPLLNGFYCHLTTYPDLCYESISSIIVNTTVILQSNPAPIFSASIRAAVDQLNATSISISKSPSLLECGKWASDSMSRLNESLSVLGAESYIESLTYDELDDVMARVVGCARGASKCLSGIGGGVEEVKMGVERARKIMVNGIGLLRSKEAILDDFYGRFGVHEYEGDYYYNYYDHYSYQYFDYGFLICFYCGLYLFLALLYLLFWRSN